jgi:peptidyl-prolyl cis-trans isomerase B (cyclophilin B)
VRVRTALTLLIVCTAGVLAGCGGGTKIAGAGATTAQVTTAAAAAAPDRHQQRCLDKGRPAPGKKAQYTKAEQVLKNGVDATIVMKTSCGTLNIKLDTKAGGPIPNSVAFLASKGFYDGLTFRVIPNFVLQGGEPSGPGRPGYKVVGAVPPGYQYKLGDFAMAKAARDPPGTSGSKFFVISGPQGEAYLTAQPDYGILGHAADPVSLATIKRIAALAVTNGPPSKPVWIISATVQPAG